MNVSLPDSLKSFWRSSAPLAATALPVSMLRELIRKERDRERLRALLLEGAASPPTVPADDVFFDELRERVHTPRQSVEKPVIPCEHRRRDIP